MLYELPKDFLGGAVFFGLRDAAISGPVEYFQIMNTLRPLLGDATFAASTPGFYINTAPSPKRRLQSLRLNYFSTSAGQTLDAVYDFARINPLFVLEEDPVGNRSKPRDLYNEGADASELNFKNFLNANSRICLEMLRNLGQGAFQALVATYRYAHLPGAETPESILVPALISHSASYNELKTRGMDRHYWADMFRVHRSGADPSIGFHFMLNMVWAQAPGVDTYDAAVLARLLSFYEP